MRLKTSFYFSAFLTTLCYLAFKYFMNYPEALNYLYQQLPMFTRVGSSAFRNNLINTIELCKRLKNPQHRFKSIHVGGTNGKGSTSHMLAAVLQTAGYKTGLYTSPHLRDFRERIRINGEMINKEFVVDFVNQHVDDFEEISPSFFEMTVGMAFEAFAENRVDVAIIEVGLGGRLDSTNIIAPLLSVITNIGWDHMNILGNTLTAIAQEKAGIIKKDTPVVIGEYQDDVAEVFKQKALLNNATIRFASEEWHVLQMQKTSDELITIDLKNTATTLADSYQLDLTGSYQVKNLKTVLTAVDELRKQDFDISEAHIRVALQSVTKLTGLCGRWQLLGKAPLIICDTGHNPEGIREVLINIAATSYKTLHFVIGMVKDKDLHKVLELLPQNAIYYFCQPDIPRGLPATELSNQANLFHLKGQAYPSVIEALNAAKGNAQADDLIFIGGSTFVVAEVV
jgi:dihydrofolate synthase/folylpolyglutamate synthase